VIDSGLAKEATVTGTDGGGELGTALGAAWIAQASARQRRGRAGRVQPGSVPTHPP
jgi:HrpA-like RNA helicase